MTLIIYLVLFIGIFLYRSYLLEGGHLKEKDGKLQYEYSYKSIRHKCIGIPVKGIYPFIVRREKWYHGLLKSLGLAREISTGHDELDKKLFFLTDRPDHLESILSSQTIVMALNELFMLPIKALRCSHNRVWVDLEEAEYHRGDFNPHYVLLEKLAKHMADLGEAYERPRFFLRRLLAFIVIAIHASLFCIAVTGALPIMLEASEIVDRQRLYAFSLTMAGIAAAVWFALLFCIFAGTSWIGWVIGDFLLFGLIGIVLTTGFTVLEINVEFDKNAQTLLQQPLIYKACALNCKRSGRRASTTAHRLSAEQCASREAVRSQYVDRYSSCANNNWFTFRFYVAKWADYQKHNFSFPTTAYAFDHTELNALIEIPLHSGYFGIEWVDTDKIRPIDSN